MRLSVECRTSAQNLAGLSPALGKQSSTMGQLYLSLLDECVGREPAMVRPRELVLKRAVPKRVESALATDEEEEQESHQTG